MTFEIVVGAPRKVARTLNGTPDLIVMNATFTDDCENLVVVGKRDSRLMVGGTEGMSYEIETLSLEESGKYATASADGFMYEEGYSVLASGYFLTVGGAKSKALVQRFAEPDEPVEDPLEGDMATWTYDGETHTATLTAMTDWPDEGPVWISFSNYPDETREKFDSKADAIGFSVEVSIQQPSYSIRTPNYEVGGTMWFEDEASFDEDKVVGVSMAGYRPGTLIAETGDPYYSVADNSNGDHHVVSETYHGILRELNKFDNDLAAKVGDVTVLRQNRRELYVVDVVVDGPSGDF